MSIVEFLLARIAEDEASANYAQSRGPFGQLETPGMGFAAEQHYKRHDPVRVLAECQAKRRIVAKADRSDAAWWESDYLGHLATVYADHPDYDTAWELH